MLIFIAGFCILVSKKLANMLGKNPEKLPELFPSDVGGFCGYEA